jgi:hypothetical protein
MKQINELSLIVKQSFAWNKASIDCITGMLIGLIKTRSMNLSEFVFFNHHYYLTMGRTNWKWGKKTSIF